jgi:hypothetical protein
MCLIKLHVHQYVRYISMPHFPICCILYSARWWSASFPLQLSAKFNNRRVAFSQGILQKYAKDPNTCLHSVEQQSGIFKGRLSTYHSEHYWAFQKTHHPQEWFPSVVQNPCEDWITYDCVMFQTVSVLVTHCLGIEIASCCMCSGLLSLHYGCFEPPFSWKSKDRNT